MKKKGLENVTCTCNIEGKEARTNQFKELIKCIAEHVLK